MGLNHLETDYFLKLVQIERAGSEELKKVFVRHLTQIRLRANEVRARVAETKEITDRERATFYSSWQYSFVRLLTSIDQFQTPEQIAKRLNMSVSRVQEILDFLRSTGLCNESHGKYRRSEKNTHVDASSPLAVRHHQNWRNRAIELQERMTPEDLCFTAPVSLSSKDLSKTKAILLDAISEISKLVAKSPSEEIAYLGIDWIKM